MNSMSGLRGAAGASMKGNSAGNDLRGDVIPKGYQKGRMQQFTPEQMNLFEQMFSHTSPDSYTSRLASGDEDMFADIQAPAWRDFQQAQGELGSRFSGMGMGAQRGSGFKNMANQQSSDFAMQLQSQRQGLQRQAIMDLMGMSNQILGQRPYENFLEEKPEKKKNFWQNLGGGVLRAGGAATGAYFGGTKGAKLGYQGGNELANAFGV